MLVLAALAEAAAVTVAALVHLMIQLILWHTNFGITNFFDDSCNLS